MYWTSEGKKHTHFFNNFPRRISDSPCEDWSTVWTAGVGVGGTCRTAPRTGSQKACFSSSGKATCSEQRTPPLWNLVTHQDKGVWLWLSLRFISTPRIWWPGKNGRSAESIPTRRFWWPSYAWRSAGLPGVWESWEWGGDALPPQDERKPVGALHGFLGVFRMLGKGYRWRYQDRIPGASVGVLESVPMSTSHLDQSASCVQSWWECRGGWSWPFCDHREQWVYTRRHATGVFYKTPKPSAGKWTFRHSWSRSACVVLISSLDWQSMDYWVDWMDRDSLLLEEDPRGSRRGTWLAEPSWGHGCSQRASAYVGSNQACTRVKQGGPFKEAPRVLIGLVLKETCCKNTLLKIDFTST